MANNSRNSRLREQDDDELKTNMHEFEQQDVIFEHDVPVGLSNMNDIHIDDNTNSESIWNTYNDCINSSADVVLSDPRTNTRSEPHINSNSIHPQNSVNPICTINNFRNNDDYVEDINDVFNPTPLRRLNSTFVPRSSSAESASTSSTLSSVISSSNHQQQEHQQCQQHTPQRRDSVGMILVDDQTMQPNYHPSVVSSLLSSSTRRPSTSSSDSGAAAKITPIPLDTEIDPTPINPYHNHRNSQQRYESEKFCEVKQLSKKFDDPKSVDELLANELNKLTFKKRETINEEIHGIDVENVGVKESPEMLRKCFHELDVELRDLRPEYAAFDRCQRLFGATTYLNTEELRIMFLRCDLFNCKKAAIRLCDYTEFMLEIFGDFALQRRPRLADFTDLELRILEAGGYQLLPGRDRAGRRIIANLAFDAPKEFGYLSRTRLSTYFIMALLDDVDTQRKGSVSISFWHNVSVDDFIIRKKVHAMVKCVPMRIGAFHICIPSEIKSGRVGKKSKDIGSGEGVSSGMAHVIKAMIVLSVGSKMRPHLRFHTGSVVECIYALQSFGIHSDLIPVNSSSGKLKTKQHLKWLELRRLKEDSLKHDGHKFDRIIECPNQTDVLFGRGRPIMRHPGNSVLRSVVQFKLEEYASAKSKKQTTDVTWEVVRTLKGKFGARFLKEENIENRGLGWIEVSNETARQKVRIAFRDLRTKIMKTNVAQIGEKSPNDDMEANEISGTIVNAKRKGESMSPITAPSVATSPRTTTFTTPLVRQDSSQLIQETDSSTSVFLGMDGFDIKRQRRCF